MTLVKYIVLKEGRRAYTLQGIFPKGELPIAKKHALHISETQNCHTIICEVLEDYRKNPEPISRAKSK